MIDLKLSFQVNSENNSLNVTDTTVWPADGTNRNEVMLHLFCSRELGEITTDEIAVPDTVPQTVSSWAFTPPIDGYYKVILLALPAFNPLSAYAKNRLVDFDGVVYVSLKEIVEGTSITAENCWKPVSLISDILALSSFVGSSYLVAHYLKDDQVNSCVAEKALAYAKKACGCADTCSMIEDYFWTNLYHTAALYSFGFGDYSMAGQFLGSAQLRCGTAESSPCNCN